VSSNGDEVWFGWPTSPQVEAEVAAWFDAKSFDEEMTIARRLNPRPCDLCAGRLLLAASSLAQEHQRDMKACQRWRQLSPKAAMAAGGTADDPRQHARQWRAVALAE
jgi:hypothetical protein